mgnify:CR=1 FL=1
MSLFAETFLLLLILFGMFILFVKINTTNQPKEQEADRE